MQVASTKSGFQVGLVVCRKEHPPTALKALTKQNTRLSLVESVEGRVDLVQLGPYSTLSPTFSTQSKGNERGRAELTATNFTTASRGEWKAVGRRVSGRHASLPTHPRLGDSPWAFAPSRLHKVKSSRGNVPRSAFAPAGAHIGDESLSHDNKQNNNQSSFSQNGASQAIFFRSTSRSVTRK